MYMSKKDKETTSFTRIFEVTFTTEDSAIDESEVLEVFRTEAEGMELWAGDGEHDEESPYSVAVKLVDAS